MSEPENLFSLPNPNISYAKCLALMESLDMSVAQKIAFIEELWHYVGMILDSELVD